MSKVVRIIFEYKEELIYRNANGNRCRGVSLDIHSKGIKPNDNSLAVIFGTVMMEESKNFAAVVATKARKIMKEKDIITIPLKGDEFN